MKTLNKKILFSLFFMLVLILPMSISVVHAFHKHESNLCIAKNETHYHSEITNCDQLHYFSQTIHDGEPAFKEILFEKVLIHNEFFYEFDLIQSFLKADLDRGPPVINVF